ncbi:MAG: NUDIX domain-containing protein [Tenericutes bacterium]|nr:NUDIX domain-containing protein [Mycoplasmatota bacterium]
MKLYNLVMVLNKTCDKVLMCHRTFDPYIGLLNLIGGKIDKDENYLESAYRELFEETGISTNDISLVPFIDYTWHMIDSKMFVFIGKLNKDVALVEEVNRLEWIDLDEDFFNMKKYAGEGNIGHMVEIYKQFPDIV